jgi:hypothetical protein
MITRDEIDEKLRKLLKGVERTDAGTALGIQVIVQFEMLQSIAVSLDRIATSLDRIAARTTDRIEKP